MFVFATCLFLWLVLDIIFTLYLVEMWLKGKIACAIGIVLLYASVYIITYIFIEVNWYLIW